MSTTEFFKGLKRQEEVLVRLPLEQWEALVIAIANGEKPAAENVLELLKDLGKTAQQLEAAVSMVLQCRDLRKKIAETAAADAEIEACTAKLNEATARFSELERAHSEITQPLIGRMEELGRLRHLAEFTLRPQLERLTANTPTARRIADTEKRLTALRQQEARLADGLDTLQEQLRGSEYTQSRNHPDDTKEAKARAEQLEKVDIPATKEKLREMAAQIAELNQQCEADRLQIATGDVVID